MTAAPAGDGAGRTVLAAGIGDAGEIARLHARCFDDAWSAESILALMRTPGAFAFLARDGDAAAGFILCRAAADECEIVVLGVVPERRRRGVGRRLLESALVAACGLGAARMFLEVADDNVAAQGLYAARGFREVGRRRGYYARANAAAVDAVVLGLALTRAAD